MSPENKYVDGVGIGAGTTMDNQLVFDVFSNAIRKPLIGEKATLKVIAVHAGNLYDLNTAAGTVYEFVQ